MSDLVLLFDDLEINVCTKRDVVDLVGKVDGVDPSCSHDSRQYLREGMTGHVEVSWDFINQDVPLQMTPFLIIKRLHKPVVINMLALIMGVTVSTAILFLAFDILKLSEGLGILIKSLFS